MSSGLSRDDSLVKIEELLAEFYDAESGYSELGTFCSAANLPEPADSLLNHHAHMTVTVKLNSFGSKVAGCAFGTTAIRT